MNSSKNLTDNRTSKLSEQACVIIVTYNHEEYIETCLDTVLSNDPGEVVVVDSGSTDSTVETVEKQFPEVRILQPEQNRGYGAGNNLAAKQVDSEYVVILNPDTRLGPNCLQGLLSPLEDDDEVITVPKILTYDGSQINTIGTTAHFTGLAFPNGYRESTRAFSRQSRLTALSGACFAINREKFLQIGGFEEAIFIYMEDIELSWKAAAVGLDVHYVPTATVYHDYPGIDLDADKLFNLERGRYIILRKYLGVQGSILVAPSLLMTELVTWGYALQQGSEGLRAKFRALVDGLSSDVPHVNDDPRNLIGKLDRQIPVEQLQVSPFVKLGLRAVNAVYDFNMSIIE